MTDKRAKQKPVSETAPKPMIAKCDFHIVHNEYERQIRKGDDVSDVPAIFHANLKTEKVL